jgi:CheY-like chemotaxis protein
MEALGDHPAPPVVHHALNAREALAFLRQEAPYSQAPRPGLILLDLELPEMGGRELLAIIKSNDTLKRIPVVVLTASQSDSDVMSAYNLFANAYVTKPSDPDAYVRALKGIEEFWIATVSLPCD